MKERNVKKLSREEIEELKRKEKEDLIISNIEGD